MEVVVISIDVIDHEGKDSRKISSAKYFLSFSRDRRQRSGSPPVRDRRRGGAAGGGSRSRSPHSRSPVPRR